MSRIDRLVPCLILAVLACAPALFAQEKPAAPAAPAAPDATPAPAAPAAPATTPAAPPPPATAPAPEAPATLTDAQQNQPLHDDIDDFWHYGKIANYPMAAAFANKILGKVATPTPEVIADILSTFEKTASAHGDNLDDWMLRWEGVDSAGMKDLTIKLQDVLRKGRFARRSDPNWIKQNILGLAVNERAYHIHLERLRESGELAVPFMINYLQSKNPDEANLKDPIRRALVDMGRAILNPLVACTETKDDDLQLTLINVLSQIGYDVAAPYLSRIADDRTHPGLAEAASLGMRRMGVRNVGNVADRFYALAEKFYYNNAAIQADLKAPSAYMWFYNDGALNFKEVPPAIFSDLMAERECEYALAVGPGTRDALSLWLCANNKMEIDLPEGAQTGVFDASRPNANYFNVYAGTQYLNAALTRALQDHNAPLALKLIKSLATIVGPSSQGSGVRFDPLIAAMRYSDRVVRFEAAFALSNGLPNTPFPGHELVAPLLAEAISQTGTANVLAVASSQADEQKYATDLKQFGFASGTSPELAFTNAVKLPSVDVIVFNESLGNAAIDRIYMLAAASPRYARAGKVIITASRLTPWAQRALSDPFAVVTQAPDAGALAAAIEDARKRAGGLPLDEKVATDYAVKAAQMIQRLAAAHTTAFDLGITLPTLLAALNDKRPEVVKAVGEALSLMNTDQVQVSLMTTVVGEKTADDVRISLLQSLTKNAKAFGNRLPQPALDDLQKQVDSNASLDVRTAAAEARGALNLSADQAKELIVKQAKH